MVEAAIEVYYFLERYNFSVAAKTAALGSRWLKKYPKIANIFICYRKFFL